MNNDHKTKHFSISPVGLGTLPLHAPQDRQHRVLAFFFVSSLPVFQPLLRTAAESGMQISNLLVS